MDQLSTLDAGFLQAEDADPNISLAIGGVSVLEGPMPDFDALAATLTERLTTIPRLRQVLHTHRLDMGAPEWEDRPDLDRLITSGARPCRRPATTRRCSG